MPDDMVMEGAVHAHDHHAHGTAVAKRGSPWRRQPSEYTRPTHPEVQQSQALRGITVSTRTMKACNSAM